MSPTNDRLRIRLTRENKNLLVRAAQLEGVKLSQFVLGPAIKRAHKRVAEVQQITTTDTGYQNLLDALAKPPQPTPALLAAMRDYQAAGIRSR